MDVLVVVVVNIHISAVITITVNFTKTGTVTKVGTRIGQQAQMEQKPSLRSPVVNAERMRQATGWV